MSQDYTPVNWVDETTSQQGTLINAERLNQMQTAHHYADGFEEVDAIPTEDPGVDYHKVVYCTADATFYRWDGEVWTADIDEDTKHLLDQEIARAEHAEGLIQGYLDAHEANHNNPHAVTKAQVGLGNCDNTADLDKPISTAAQAALDTKADKATTLAGYGITDAVATGGAQTVGGVKTFTDNPLVSNGEPAITIKNTDVSVSGTPASTEGATIHFAGNDGEDLARIKMTKGSSGMTILRAYIHGPHGDSEAHLVSDSQDTYMTGPARAYNAANASDIMTIGVYKAQTDTLLATKADTTALTDGSVTKVGTADLGTDTKPIKLVAGVPTAVTNDLVSTSGDQSIAGVKTFTESAILNKSANIARHLYLKSSQMEIGVNPAGTCYNCIEFVDKNGSTSNLSRIGEILQYVTNNGDNFVSLRTYDYAAGSSHSDLILRYDANGDQYVTAPARAYDPSHATDVATIATLDGYSPMVRTSGNQVIAGNKFFTSPIIGFTILGYAESSGSRTAGTYQVMLKIPKSEITIAPTRSHIIFGVTLRGNAAGFDMIDIAFNNRNATGIKMAWAGGMAHTSTYILSMDDNYIYVSRVNISNSNDGVASSIITSMGVAFSGTFGTISAEERESATLAGTEIGRVNSQ